ncbi:sirohydrochlorin chelatase [Rhodococcus rhodnii]|uniref:Cobalamin biosynthesis protein CbiX n=2 Tax=Rhodococcus rhodnii TaxID=38312 RepID=R7WJ81_9NOCA|nr:sirohydrochlorin chelatase [Rhodococcus rhodnii]EOM75327.1 hypothetical protein Rrhod_3125 [Rhodococcus rhodnii LMG 5362]TXG90612.1 sirohydrochlorin chelatase [Rhodococcus rhodnii]
MAPSSNSGAPTVLLVAHGTRDPRGVAAIGDLADAAASRTGAPVRVAFVDVLGPTPDEVLADAPGPVLVVPVFLASGFHVHTDVRGAAERSGRADVVVAPALGPDPALARLLADRVAEAGPCDAVILAAAGSSDLRAIADIETAATQLAEHTGAAVSTAYVATGTPRVPDAVQRARAAGADRVVVATYLLAPGLFHSRLADAGADVVTAPLLSAGGTARVADLVAERHAAHLDSARSTR